MRKTRPTRAQTRVPFPLNLTPIQPHNQHSLCAPAVLRTADNCEGVFGVEASDQPIGDRVLLSRLDGTPNDEYTPSSPLVVQAGDLC